MHIEGDDAVAAVDDEVDDDDDDDHDDADCKLDDENLN